MNIDTQLLREQIEYLLTYPWREGMVPEQIEGIVNMLEAILDQKEGM